MYDFSKLSAADVVKCGREIRALTANARTMEDAGNAVVHFFYDNLIEEGNETKSCVLIRLFKTHDYNELGDDLKLFSRKMLDQDNQAQNFKCFTLLATWGANAEWQSRQKSTGHQAIPLPSAQVLEKIPMMRNMVKQMGLEINSVINPDPKIIMDLSQRTYNVFYVPIAEGSPHVPAQENFVIPYGVKSVLGFGGVLPSGNVFVIIIFSRTRIPVETADRFALLALNVKMILLPFENAVFKQ